MWCIVKRDLWLFLTKLLLFTLILGYIWFSGLQRSYPFIIDPLASWFFKLVGVKKWWLSLTVEHFTNLIPYLGLILASPGFFKNWKHTLTALLGGLAVLVAVHILMSAAMYYIVGEYGMSKSAYKIIVPIYLVNDALPLILWLVFYPELLSKLFNFVGMGRAKKN